MTINVYELIGEFAVATDDGQKLYDRMVDLLSHQQTIVLEFQRVRVVATPFLNASIGQLLKTVSPEDLHQKISFLSLSTAGHKILEKVIGNAKQYYHGDPKAREALDRILSDHTEEH